MKIGTRLRRQEIKHAVAEYPHWYHSIDLGEGVVTPGVNDSARELRFLNAIGLPKDCHGKRVLDLGCQDGFFSFELERRGAQVTALDVRSPGESGFEIARRFLKSQVKFRQGNVYDLRFAQDEKFDLVLCLGLLYHLRHPLLALDQIRNVITDSGVVFAETQVLTGYENESLMRFENGQETKAEDPSVAWVPNLTALKKMLARAQFTVIDHYTDGQRAGVCAKPTFSAQTAYWQELDQRNWK